MTPCQPPPCSKSSGSRSKGPVFTQGNPKTNMACCSHPSGQSPDPRGWTGEAGSAWHRAVPSSPRKFPERALACPHGSAAACWAHVGFIGFRLCPEPHSEPSGHTWVMLLIPNGPLNPHRGQTTTKDEENGTGQHRERPSWPSPPTPQPKLMHRKQGCGAPQREGMGGPWEV